MSKYEPCRDCVNHCIPFNDGKNYYILEVRDHYDYVKRYFGFVKLINEKHTLLVDGGAKEGIDYKFVRISMVDPEYIHDDDDNGWELNEEDIDALINRLSYEYQNVLLDRDGNWVEIKRDTLFEYLMVHMNYEYNEYYDEKISIPNYKKLLKR